MASDDSLPTRILSWSFLALKIIIACCALKGLLILCGIRTAIPLLDPIFYFVIDGFKALISGSSGLVPRL